MLDINKIYHEDCLKGLEQIEEGTVALTVTSPPYYYYRSSRYVEENPDDKVVRMNKTEYLDFIENFAGRLFKITSNGGFFVLNYGDSVVNTEGGYDEDIIIGEIVERIKKCGFKIIAKRIWYKKINPFNSLYIINFHKTPMGRYRTFTREWEWLIFFYKGEIKKEQHNQDLIYDEWKNWISSVWQFDMTDRKKPAKSEHNLIFPLELPYRIIKMYSRPRDIVLDPFAGTGTTLRAAKMLGRNYIGFEIHREYVDIAEKLLKETSGSLLTL